MNYAACLALALTLCAVSAAGGDERVRADQDDVTRAVSFVTPTTGQYRISTGPRAVAPTNQKPTTASSGGQS